MVNRRTGGPDRRYFFAALAAVALIGGGLIAWQVMSAPSGPVVSEVVASPSEAEGYLYGNPDAPVQILEFADFECPACARYATITMPDVKRRIVDAGLASYRFFDFPLPQHRNSVAASNAAACAGEQQRFWEMHDRIYERQDDWHTGATSNPRRIFRTYAGDLGLNVSAWEECVDSQRHMPRILGNRAEGERRGVQSTPTFVIGNRMVAGIVNADEMLRLVREAGASATGAAAPAAADTAAAPR